MDKTLEGPDHSSSLNPIELKNMIDGVREVEKALGSPVKKRSSVEEVNCLGMRRSLHAEIDIKKGEKITKKMISMKRPYNGLHSKYLKTIIGKAAAVDIKKDQPITYSKIIW